jgi:hypothetical protein
MKYIKQYEDFGKEYIYDIREFFSNLKKLTFLFEDYHNFLDLFDEIDTKLNIKHKMPFFGFTNDFQFSPIVDTVTSQLHKIFDMTVQNDYQGIYDGCNEEKYGWNYFDKKSRPYFTIESHISKTLAKALNFLDKPYFDTKFIKYTDYHFIDKTDMSNKIKNIIKDSTINKKYNIKVWENEVRIIAKKRIDFTPAQLEEIEKAKEFGLEIYKHLKPLADAQKHLTKYNM